ncbi:MAG: ComEA family DNA-binding protein [Balneolaceae bacterium]|nr:ComEA family DNA-binding protein [Balneolaceae bacterium]
MSWKRKLFFIFEALKITPAERKSVSILLVLMVVLAAVNQYIEPQLTVDEHEYAALETEFQQRSQALEMEEAELMKRYNPAVESDIPKKAVSADTTDSSSAGTAEDAISETININTADLKALQKLTGIGPAYAQRIINHRNEHGLFTSFEELLKIKGIGKKRLEKIKPFIKLKE